MARFGPLRGQQVTLPYDRCIEIQEAAGGWVASVVDLARFATAMAYPGDVSPLKPETIALMTATDLVPRQNASGTGSGEYALGWYVDRDEKNRTIVYHTGHLPGTQAFMGWRSDGIGAAVLFNSDTSPQNVRLMRPFLSELTDVIDQIASWPDHDYFPMYFPPEQPSAE
jgi:CubicO group peptidase (beta-lactamase class C family)